jgi:hypothetical protein
MERVLSPRFEVSSTFYVGKLAIPDKLIFFLFFSFFLFFFSFLTIPMRSVVTPAQPDWIEYLFYFLLI